MAFCEKTERSGNLISRNAIEKRRFVTLIMKYDNDNDNVNDELPECDCPILTCLINLEIDNLDSYLEMKYRYDAKYQYEIKIMKFSKFFLTSYVIRILMMRISRCAI